MPSVAEKKRHHTVLFCPLLQWDISQVGFWCQRSTGKWRDGASGRPAAGGQGWARAHRRAAPAMQCPGMAPHILYAAPRTFMLLNVLALASELEQRGNIIQGHAWHKDIPIYQWKQERVVFARAGAGAGKDAGTVCTAVSVTRQQYSLGKNWHKF